MRVKNVNSGVIQDELALKAAWVAELEYDMEPGDRLSYMKKDYPFKSWLANLLTTDEYVEVTE